MDITTEVWKDIPEFTGYQASDIGRIRSFWIQVIRLPGEGKGYKTILGTEPKILKPRLRKGYPRVNIRHDSGEIRTEKVCHLVLWAFVGPCPDGMVCCHDPDPERSNSQLGNLRWDTQRENLQDAGRHGTKKIMSDDQIADIIQMDESGILRSEIADRFGVARSCVTKILIRNGKRSHRPYKPPHLMTDIDIAEAQRMSDQGISHKAIGKVLGVSRPTVTKWLARSSAKLA